VTAVLAWVAKSRFAALGIVLTSLAVVTVVEHVTTSYGQTNKPPQAEAPDRGT